MIPTKAIQIARDFIARYEGYSDTPYLDVVGKWTIGYGHLIKPYENFTKITQEEGWNILEADMSWAVDCVDTHVDVDLEDHQYASVISLVFNIGCTAFRGSTILKLLNEGHFDLAESQFKRWSKADGKTVAGLLNRRNAEAKLFRGEE